MLFMCRLQDLEEISLSYPRSTKWKYGILDTSPLPLSWVQFFSDGGQILVGTYIVLGSRPSSFVGDATC